MTAAAAVAVAMRAAEARVVDVGAETVASAEAARQRAWLRAGRASEQVGNKQCRVLSVFDAGLCWSK